VQTKQKSKIFQSGEVVYREGEPSNSVYFIERGEVEVLRTARDGELHLLGILGPGKIFGESGVILDHPRSTTTRAHTNLVVKIVGRATFLAQFSDAPLAMPLLRMLCERLGEADRHLVGRPAGGSVELVQVGRVRLLAGSDSIKQQIGHRVIDVTTLPFRIGRRPIDENPEIVPNVDLEIVTRHTLQMSHEHFAIQTGDGQLFVEDLNSQTGTLVNGHRIARFADSRIAPVKWGENEIIAGPQDSPIRFLLVVERKAD
jgi:hypothetical protein